MWCYIDQALISLPPLYSFSFFSFLSSLFLLSSTFPSMQRNNHSHQTRISSLPPWLLSESNLQEYCHISQSNLYSSLLAISFLLQLFHSYQNLSFFSKQALKFFISTTKSLFKSRTCTATCGRWPPHASQPLASSHHYLLHHVFVCCRNSHYELLKFKNVLFYV